MTPPRCADFRDAAWTLDAIVDDKIRLSSLLLVSQARTETPVRTPLRRRRGAWRAAISAANPTVRTGSSKIGNAAAVLDGRLQERGKGRGRQNTARFWRIVARARTSVVVRNTESTKKRAGQTGYNNRYHQKQAARHKETHVQIACSRTL